MRKLDIEELRHIQLEILDDVDRFCRENQLRYSLCGGTLLGAVRHKGYIPWDDDIDILMPRPDYERFASSYHSDRNVVLDLRRNDACLELCLKVCRKGTVMKDIEFGRSLWGVNIDIFPVDGVPEDADAHCGKILQMRSTLARICPFYKVVPERKALWFVKYLLKRVRYPYLGSSLKLKERIDAFAASCPFGKLNLSGAVLGSYGKREPVPSEVFMEYGTILFEGREYSCIKSTDTYLSALYGDYMTLPPMEKRVAPHLYDSYID
jgi:lipopolysaccharide cholinephosphotransferase